jgi:hypothetical protein
MTATPIPQAGAGAADNPSIPQPPPPPPPAPRTVASYERRDVRATIARLRNQ